MPGNFTSVVKFQQDGPCTATKIKGTNKFLTAAHCISNELATSLTIFTGNDGSSGQINLSIPSGGIQKHPSFKLRNGSNALDVYDIAVITTTTATPGIAGLDLPPSENPHAVPSTGTAYGFGCDANDSTHSGKRQSGFFNLTGGTLDHCLSSTGPDVVCAGDSGGPLLSNADASIIGVFDAGFGGSVSFWSRTGNVLRWLFNPKPGNDPSLFQGVAGDLVFMHNKKVGSVPTGLCMVGNSNVHYPPNPVNVILHKCSDWKGFITGKASGWTIVNLPSYPAGRYLFMGRSGCLTPNGSTSGADLRAEQCAANLDDPDQLWYFTRSPASPFATVRIKHHSTNLCIRTEGAGTSAGTQIELGTCDAGANDSVQSWVASR